MADKGFDEQAVEFSQDVYRFLYHLSGKRDTAEDLTQETFLRALRYRHSYNAALSLRSWLLKIAHNVYRDWLRENRLCFSFEEPQLQPQEISTPSFEERWMESIPDEEILRALRALPDEFREVVLLRDVEEMTYQEIADTLNCPLGTVMSRLHRGRNQLREQLLDFARDRRRIGETEESKVRKFPRQD